MRQRLMDILACPHCKSSPLTLKIIEEDRIEVKRQYDKVLCLLYCGRFAKYVKDANLSPSDCQACMGIDVRTGVLTCNNCERWYPIIDTIPHMLPDEMRKEEEDKKFLESCRDQITTKVLLQGKPFNLGGT